MSNNNDNNNLSNQRSTSSLDENGNLRSQTNNAVQDKE